MTPTDWLHSWVHILHPLRLRKATSMSPDVILQIALPIIEAMPTIAKSFSALFSAIEAMISHGASVGEAVAAVKAAAPAVTAAVIANTPTGAGA
jgi:hypothetical protein